MKQTTITESEIKPLAEEVEESLSEKESSSDHHQNEAYQSDEDSEEVVDIKEPQALKSSESNYQFGTSFERTK